MDTNNIEVGIEGTCKNKIEPIFILKYVYDNGRTWLLFHHEIVKYVERVGLGNSVLK